MGRRRPCRCPRAWTSATGTDSDLIRFGGFSLRRVVAIAPVLAVAACGWGVAHPGFNDQEWARVPKAVVMPPPDPSNRVSGDPAAAKLGQQLFFDARLSGPLPACDAGTPTPAGFACTTCHAPTAGL